MSYVLDALRDKPLGLFLMDDSSPLQDYSPYNRNATISGGTPSQHAGLVKGATYAPVLGGGISASFDAPVFQQGYEDRSFTLAAWMKRVGTGEEQQIIGNQGLMDGITLSGTIVSFVTKYASAPDARCTFDLQYDRAALVHGVHNGGKNSLYVNGVLVDEISLTEEQQSNMYRQTNGTFGCGVNASGSLVAVNAISYYQYAATEELTMRHFISGRNLPSPDEVVSTNAGDLVLLSLDNSQLFLNQFIDNENGWDSGIFDNVSVVDDRLVPTSDSSGKSSPGSWTGSVNLDQSNSSSIYGMQLDWDAVSSDVNDIEYAWTGSPNASMSTRTEESYVLTNLEPYPVAQAGIGSYGQSSSGFGGTNAVQSTVASGGPTNGEFFRATAQASGIGAAGFELLTQRLTLPGVGTNVCCLVTPGLTYTSSVYVRSSIAQKIQLVQLFYNASGAAANNSYTSYTLAANTWTRISNTAIAGDTAAGVRFAVRTDTGSSSWTSGDTLDMALVMITQSDGMLDYFDGWGSGRSPSAYVWYPVTASGQSGGSAVKLSNAGVSVFLNNAGAMPDLPTIQAGNYDLLVMDNGYGGITASALDLAYSAYQAGISVYTTGNDTTASSGCPIWTGSTSVGSGAGLLHPTTPTLADHPVAKGWDAYDNGTDDRIYLTGPRPTATVCGTYTYVNDNSQQIAIIAEENPIGNGARFVHIQPYIRSQQLLDAVYNWLINGPTLTRESYSWMGTRLASSSVARTNDSTVVNLIQNPRFSLDNSYSIQYAGTGGVSFRSQEKGDTPVGNTFVRQNWTTAPTAANFALKYTVGIGTYYYGLTPSTTYTFSTWVRFTKAGMFRPTIERWSGITGGTNKGSILGSNVNIPANTWQRLTITFVTDSDAGVGTFYGMVVYDFFDGDSTPAIRGPGETIQASLDGVTWNNVVRGENISLIPAGFDPTGKILQIKASFPGGVVEDESYIDSLNIIGISQTDSMMMAGRVVTYTGVYPEREHQFTEYHDNYGVRIPAGANVSISPDTLDSTVTRTIELLIKRDGVNPTVSLTGTNYINGAAGSATLPDGQWVLWHIVLAADSTSAIQINGSAQVGYVGIYDYALTASQSASIYAEYTGTDAPRFADSSVINVSESLVSANIYQHDWAISASG
jgi:hypothetical protein